MKIKTLALSLLLSGSLSLRAADSTIINLTTLTGLADADSFVVVDASDTTQSAQGTTKDITTLNVLSFLYSDTAFASSWNGVTGASSASGAVPTKNAVYDIIHTFDTDDDGLVNVLDGIAAAGFPYTNSSGAVQGVRSVAEGAAIDVTNGDGASGNPTIAFDSTEVEAVTWFAGGNASNVWNFNLSGTDTAITFSSGVINVSTGTLQQGGVDVVTTSGSNTLTNKTFDAAGTGNVFKMKSYPQFTSPLRVDGTNCTIGTTSTTLGYGLATFSNSVDEASNWAEFRIIVPADWDTAVDPKVRVVDLIGADTSTRQYSFQVLDVNSSASGTGTPGTKIDVNISADGSGASGDIEISSQTTLTGWGAALTPGHMAIIRVNRDGDDASDASTVNSTLIAFELEYGVTQ